MVIFYVSVRTHILLPGKLNVKCISLLLCSVAGSAHLGEVVADVRAAVLRDQLGVGKPGVIQCLPQRLRVPTM